MSTIFLSASVPIKGRGEYYKSADPYLIQCAVRELVIAVIGKHEIVWGGHPAITPMIWAICEDMKIDYAQKVILYQSLFFEDRFPEENKKFRNVVFTEAVANDRDSSLLYMRKEMLSRPDIIAAVFIGGMEGVAAEYELFTQFHPDAKVLLVAAPGGAARLLAENLGILGENGLFDIDFSRLFRTKFDL